MVWGRRNNNWLFVVIGILILLIPYKSYAINSIFEGFHKTGKQQKNVISSCEDSQLVYSGMENTQNPYICIRAFLNVAKSKWGYQPETIVFPSPCKDGAPYILCPDLKEELNDSIFELGMVYFEPMYKCVDMTKLLNEGKLLIMYDCNLDGLHMDVTLIAIKKDFSSDKLHRIKVKYIFHYAFNTAICEKENFKWNLNYFVGLLKEENYDEIVSEDLLLFEDSNYEYAWNLVDIEFSKPSLFLMNSQSNSFEDLFGTFVDLGQQDTNRILRSCLMDFITSKEIFNGQHPEAIVFEKSNVKFQISIDAKWSSERIQEEKNKKSLWVNEYPFEFAPKYECTDFDKLLGEKKTLITYQVFLVGNDLDVRLTAFINDKQHNQLQEISASYIFNLTYTKNICYAQLYKDTIKDFFKTLKKNPGKLVSKKGFLLESFNELIGWIMTDTYYHQSTLDYKPGINTLDLLFHINE